MARDYDRRILKYPLVEYIPLSIRLLAEGEYGPEGISGGDPLLVACDKAADLAALAKEKRLTASPGIDWAGQVVVYLGGGRAHQGLYRGQVVTLIGDESPCKYHLFAVTKRYFYKPRIYFEFYTRDGRFVARSQSIKVQTQP